jgi:transcriptional regulator with XRE-family HTH domain
MTELDVVIANRIRVRRVELGMSQTDLGQALGVTFQQIQKYEKAVNHVSSSRLHLIAETLEVPLSFFYDDDGTRNGRVIASLLNHDTTFSVRLLRAYGRIPDVALRHLVVTLMEAMAESSSLTPVETKRPTNGRRSGSE